jgi:hypothetical protein
MSAEGGPGGGPGGAMRNMENHEALNILDQLEKDGKVIPTK